MSVSFLVFWLGICVEVHVDKIVIPPPLPFALYPIGVKFGPGYTPLNFSSRGDSKGSQPISVLQLLSKGSLPEDIIKSNEGASLTIC